MALFRWPRPWSPKAFARPARRRPTRRRASLRLECLESRTLFAVNALSLAANGLVSDTAAGNVQGPASVSGDGRYVVYTSSAANLAPNQVMDSKSALNVFLYDRATGQTTLVSHRARANAADTTYLQTTATGSSKNAVISADGKWVAFVSNSDDLIGGAALADDTYTLTVQGYSGGTFALTYGGQTATLNCNATASDVQTALEGLSGV
ncbi:MAG TPA: hypothetical protein VFA26_00120, partial [Gemmataceae bacterium]|nr:hypothetical protein [Gemmataceae bacterium]